MILFVSSDQFCIKTKLLRVLNIKKQEEINHRVNNKKKQ